MEKKKKKKHNPKHFSITVCYYRITPHIRPWPYIRYKAIWHLRKCEISYYIRPWPSISVIRPPSLYKARGGHGGNLFTNKAYVIGKRVIFYTKMNAYEGSQAQLSAITDPPSPMLGHRSPYIGEGRYFSKPKKWKIRII